MEMVDARQDLAVIVEKLNNVDNLRDLHLVRECIYEILTLSTNGYNVVAALPVIVKLLAHSDAFVKRIAGELIAIYAEQKPEMVLLATNTLVQDCKDVNPVVRGHALQVLGSLPSQATAEMLNSIVTAGLEDSSSYVRQSAALVSICLHQVSPTAVTESGLWDSLYTHLSDSDSATVASCLCALEEIFANEKGVVISNKLGQYLISNISMFTPTVQRFVLQFLIKHSPKSKAQVFDHLNDLDDCLSKSTSLATTLCSLELFCHMASHLPKVRSKAYLSTWQAIKTNLARERCEEIVTGVLDYLCTTDFPVDVLAPDYNKFFCRDDDSVFFVKQKIRILSKLLNAENAENIFDELARCSRHLNPGALKEIVHSLSEAIGTNPKVEESYVLFLKRLLQSNNIDVTECIMQVLPMVTFSKPSHWSILAPVIQDIYEQIESVPGKIALLEVLRVHGSLLDNAPEILEQIMLDQEERDLEQDHPIKHWQVNKLIISQTNNNQRLKLTLLSAMVQLCFKYPAKVQSLLAKLMEQCIKDQNRTVRDRALFLFGYLLGRSKQDIK